jgi:hypothetical protein
VNYHEELSMQNLGALWNEYIQKELKKKGKSIDELAKYIMDNYIPNSIIHSL